MQNINLMNYRKLYLLGITTAAVTLLTALPMSAALAQDEESAAETEAVAEPMEVAPPAPATTLERIAAKGAIHLGYSPDSQPFSYRNESGQAAGYSVALCQRVAEEVKATLGLPNLTVQWTPVDADSRFTQVADGQIDLLCTADSVTLSRRQEVAFSLPIFPGGIGALLRDDTAEHLKRILEGGPQPKQPLWRGYPAQVLQHMTFAVVSGSTAESWAAERINTFKIPSKVQPVDSFEAGISDVLSGKADVLFGDRAFLQDAATNSERGDELRVAERLFTLEPVALAMARGDEDFRLLVDGTLSKLYSSGEFSDFFGATFGEPNERVKLFFLSNTQPQ
jgi:polar amino acid transport system substrate-binding protein